MTSYFIENIKFEILQYFYVNNNKIFDCNGLKYANLFNLKSIRLQNNQISKVHFLKDINFGKIITLDLENNNIQNLCFLEHLNNVPYGTNIILNKNKIDYSLQKNIDIKSNLKKTFNFVLFK